MYHHRNEQMAAYAMSIEHHGGRLHGDEVHPYRDFFQRDRDRIIHSKAFRRLGYKTQVFINSAGDNYRTRLTHSLEVAQISRSISQALGLNPDFAEALALSHDLGHTPFGHAGQEALNNMMKDHGGFEHNRQSLRIVSFLESRYLDFRGLNLTRSVLKGMMKHKSIYKCDRNLADVCLERGKENPCLEAALVDMCDRIAYVHHDLEDGLDSRILNTENLAELSIWNQTWERLYKNQKNFSKARKSVKIRNIIREMMNECIHDLLTTTSDNLEKLQLKNLEDLLKMPAENYPVKFSPEMKQQMNLIQNFLYNNLYRYSEVMQMSRRGSKIIETLFDEFRSYPQLMPVHYQDQIDQDGLERVVSDYISGMTDRFAFQEYSRLTGLQIS